MRPIRIVAALPLIALFAGAAAAQEAACTKQLKMVDEIQMQSRGNGASTVPVEINGNKLNLTFATASTATQISEATAKSLNLPIASGGDVALFDFDGRPTAITSPPPSPWASWRGRM